MYVKNERKKRYSRLVFDGSEMSLNVHKSSRYINYFAITICIICISYVFHYFFLLFLFLEILKKKIFMLLSIKSYGTK